MRQTSKAHLEANGNEPKSLNHGAIFIEIP